MQTLFLILKQQIIGVINLSIPLLVLVYFYPTLVFTFPGVLTCSLVMGIYIGFLNYRATKNHANHLQFIPSGQSQYLLEQWITDVGMNPATIQLRYGYCQEGVALAIFNTVVIDPVICNLFDQDPEAMKAKQAIELYVIPTLPQERKNKIARMKEIISPDAQHFIFIHELGHVFYSYSIKKIILNGFIGMFATYCGISVGVIVFTFWGGLPGTICGMVTGGLVDLIVSYLSNIFFKVREEKNADFFAAQRSSPEVINAAAHFFEQHQAIMDSEKERGDILAQLPSTLMTGHPNGKTRAKYLRDL